MKKEIIIPLLMAIVMMAMSPTRVWAQTQDGPAQNEIWYTTDDGKIYTPYIDNSWDVEVATNTYTNGRGLITFKQNLTEIGNRAFSYDETNNKHLETIVFPEGVTKIGSEALNYYGITTDLKLLSVTIPSTVTELANNVFAETSVEDLYLKSATPPTTEKYTFYNAVFGSVHVPQGSAPLYNDSVGWKDHKIVEMVDGPADNEIWYTTSDGQPIAFEDVFNFGPELEYLANTYNEESGHCVLSFTTKITLLGGDAFAERSTLTSITFPSSLSVIDGSINYCSNLTTINLPEGLKSVGWDAFVDNAYTSITIPSSMTSIGEGAFSSGTLTDVYVKRLTPITGCHANAFSNYNNLTLHVPAGKASAYAASNFWGQFNIITDGTVTYQPAPQVTDANYKSFGFTQDNYKAYVGYYVIGNANQLAWFANIVNNNYMYHYANAVLTADIDMSTLCQAISEDVVKILWTTIDDEANTYQGTIVGNGKKIYYDGTINLTDANLFKDVLVDITTPAAPTYTRTMTNQWGTLVVPFDVVLNDRQQAFSCYKITGVTDDQLTLRKLSGTLAANTPVLVRMNSDVVGQTDNLSLQASNCTLKAVKEVKPVAIGADDNYSLAGTYVKLEPASSDYFISNNSFWNVGYMLGKYPTAHVAVSPFRAYIKSTATSGAKQLVIGAYDDETTSINNEQLTINNEAGAVYNLNGQRLTAPRRGLNIINGKKVMVR